MSAPSITQLQNYPITKFKIKGRLASRPLDFLVPTRSQHLGAVDVDRITFHRAGDSHMMSLMSLE